MLARMGKEKSWLISAVAGHRVLVLVLVNLAHGFFVTPDHIVDHTVEEVGYTLFQFSFRV